MKFTSEVFEQILGVRLSRRASSEINSFGIDYDELRQDQELKEVKLLVDEIFRLDLVSASRKRMPDWEDGWGQNLRDFEKDFLPENLFPKYFGKYPINRLNQKLVLSNTEHFELKMLRSLQTWIFDEYLSDFDSIYEFGCGTGHNLIFLRKFNAFAKLTGLDWVESSQALITLIGKQAQDTKLFGQKFDYFNPNSDLVLEENSAVFTVASLEQIGSEFLPFVNFLFRNQPKLIVHIEPFEDLLDPYNLLDNLSIQYMRKRGYINGYCEYIQDLESQGKAKIHKFQRSFIGSRFIDGYTILIWSPR